MSGIARESDLVNTGHLCDEITTLDGNSTGGGSKVYMNGLGVCCVGDKTITHNYRLDNQCVPHIAVITTGSSTVFIGGKAVARIGDSCDEGTIISGSNDIFTN